MKCDKTSVQLRLQLTCLLSKQLYVNMEKHRDSKTAICCQRYTVPHDGVIVLDKSSFLFLVVC